ncbi:hypothetical protein BDZ89DRAFT_357083 [Hymenopellis radicata]|nr:hypothetical protein BDZ89DRAFT_560993 [Hymenopellis radicata]KAF9018124.1 hypothetical protein BDZ89DRAFT_357083 [Hymenopellis radicata]
MLCLASQNACLASGLLVSGYRCRRLAFNSWKIPMFPIGYPRHGATHTSVFPLYTLLFLCTLCASCRYPSPYIWLSTH